MNDEGNTVVFSRKWGNYSENDRTGERIQFERVGDTFELVLKTRTLEDGDEEGFEVCRRRREEIRRHGGGRK